MKKKTLSFKLRHNSNGIYKPDFIFLFLVSVLSAFGTLMVFSAGYAYADFRYDDSFYFVKKQIIWLILGTVVMIMASAVPSRLYYSMTTPLYALTVVLLVLVLIIGFVGNGAQRWISLGPLTIQPSEIAKLTMIMMLSKYLSDYESRITDNESRKNIFVFGTLIPFGIILLPTLLVMLQKHLSCIIILGTIGILLIIAAGVNLRYLTMFVGAGALGVTYIALFTDYTKQRITVWQNPEAYKLTGGWQTLQGLMAIGSGGLYGAGFGKSILKYCYVSEPANDMIFAILCEELGLLGALITIFLFLLLVIRGIKISLNANNSYARLLGIGICIKMSVQVLLNIAVVTNAIPNTGISLPFFSYGGSSLIMLFFEMGIILSISRNSKIRN